MHQQTVVVPVIEEEFLASLDGPLGKDANAMVAVDHHDLCVAVGVDGVIGKADLVALASSIHHKVCTHKHTHTHIIIFLHVTVETEPLHIPFTK